jgi:sugar O-acyltransferase (sialic acid O-acetyltransferase NeuD family)
VSFVVETRSTGSEPVGGIPVRDIDNFLSLPGERWFSIAIGDSRERERIARKCIAAGARPMEIADATARRLGAVSIGPGAITCHGSVITSDVQIGSFFHLNLFSYVAHDCVVGDFVTFAPSVQCNGNVHIGEHAYIGTGAVIRHGQRDRPLLIGAGATVGMGAVVTKDVPAGATVVGNPARIFEK